MTAEQAKARRALVWRVRKQRAESLMSNYLEVEARVIPCCASCKYNKSSRCALIPAPGVETGHRYGHKITDPEDLCLLWGASYAAFLRAFEYAYGPKAKEKPKREARPKVTVSEKDFSEQFAIYNAGKTTIKRAAAVLGVSTTTFFRKYKESSYASEEKRKAKKRNFGSKA